MSPISLLKSEKLLAFLFFGVQINKKQFGPNLARVNENLDPIL